MKWIMMATAMLVLSTESLVAQMTGEAIAAGKAPIQISDTEAAGIAQTIHGYVQGALHRGTLTLFDRKKGVNVALRVDRIVGDDPACVVFPAEGQVAVCAECSEMRTVVTDKGVKSLEEAGDKYVIWFLVERGGTVSSRVLDTFIKSVNGHPMYKWTQDAAGAWSATLVPDSP